jgi:hypothetical protein
MSEHENPSEPIETRHVHRESGHRESGHREQVLTEEQLMGRRSYFRGASWGAIIAGALVALVVMAVLNTLGIAIGAGTLQVGVEQTGFGLGAGIWWTVTALIGLFCGGWVAGRLSHSLDRAEGALQGIVTWSLFVFASLFVVTTAVGQVVGGAFGLIGQQMAAALGQVPDLAAIETTLMELGLTQEAIGETQAELIIAGEQAATAVAAGATWAFIAMLLGALICALGSILGAAMPPQGGEERMERARRVLRPRTA